MVDRQTDKHIGRQTDRFRRIHSDTVSGREKDRQKTKGQIEWLTEARIELV